MFYHMTLKCTTLTEDYYIAYDEKRIQLKERLFLLPTLIPVSSLSSLLMGTPLWVCLCPYAADRRTLVAESIGPTRAVPQG